ncbi:MAG: tRNA pseudouridine(55) synthase TruB [Acutalibacteraceae bacterium]|jgi:tRNA pseudouridine55 synthase
MDGILLLDKPAGMTSFACCAAARRWLNEKKIGHAGTLDPNATGVLPLLVGRATKAVSLLPNHDKAYTATLRFGFTSDTLDVWGQVTPTGAPVPDEATIDAALPRFRGEIMQIPPMTSALKKDGKRLYELARQGIEVERTPRPVTVYTLQKREYDPGSGELTLDCRCSSGTYIRTLCDDLGRRLGCGAVMTALRRTMAAGYTLDQCLTDEEAERLAGEGRLAERLLSVESAFAVFPQVTVTPAQATRFRNGGSLALERLRVPVTGMIRVKTEDGVFLGLGVPKGDQLAIAFLA